MYVLLFLPVDNDPEVFGPYPTPQRAAHALRRISAAAGQPMDLSAAGPLITVDVWIDAERNRYQMLKLGSDDQISVHAEIIAEVVASAHVRVETPQPRQVEKGSGLLGG